MTPALKATIDDLRRLMERATPGPVTMDDRYRYEQVMRAAGGYYLLRMNRVANWRNDAALIVALRNSLPALLDALDETEKDEQETDDCILLAQELLRASCEQICDDVDSMSGWDGDPTDVEKRFKAGVSTACEEIKCRIESIDLKACWDENAARQRAGAGETT